MQVKFTLASGREVEFGIDTGRGGVPVFVLGVRKSGSSLLNSMINDLAAANGWPVVDVGGSMFFRNVGLPEWQNDPALAKLIHPGNVYAGFRDMPLGLLGHPPFMEGPKLLMVRDPRDALVSEFFSNAYSHPIPESGGDGDDAITKLMQNQRSMALSMGIDAYVLRRASSMATTMMQYEPVARLPSTRLLKYEEFIFDKARLISTIVKHFGWKADDELIQRILTWADVRPSGEDPTRFVRKVTPGDHIEKLKPDTIGRLNEVLKPAMEVFGYSAAAGSATNRQAPAAPAPEPVKAPKKAAAKPEPVAGRSHLRTRRKPGAGPKSG